MNEFFTFLILTQHYPYSRQIQAITYRDLCIDADVGEFLQTTEQQVSKCVLEDIYSFASSATSKHKYF